MPLLFPSESTDLVFWKFSLCVCGAGHRRPCEEVLILPLPKCKDLKEGDTVCSPTLLLEPALIMKSDSPSKAYYPGRPKSKESNQFLCYPFKRSQHPKYEIIFDPYGWDKLCSLLSLSFERAKWDHQWGHIIVFSSSVYPLTALWSSWQLQLEQIHFDVMAYSEEDLCGILILYWDVF